METFEELQKANETIRTTDIKGKNYAEVNQRVKAFRMVYPNGLIETEMLSLENGVCVFRAKAYSEDGRDLLATGTAEESKDSSYINKTSFVENCETSAVGRCLGFAGFGIDTSICSAEELTTAIEKQEAEQEAAKPITKVQAKSVVALAETKGSDINEICKYFGAESIDKMTAKQYGLCMNMLNAKR